MEEEREVGERKRKEGFKEGKREGGMKGRKGRRRRLRKICLSNLILLHVAPVTSRTAKKNSKSN